jgi:3',5'-nucleoside bisphosphate phosphatase
MLVDFHLHTTCSDGVWTPARLFEEIRARELEAFCVSDHDNLDAYPLPSDLESRAFAGLEVDAHYGGHSAHILAYGVRDRASPLLSVLAKQREARLARMEAMVERCNALGLDVSMRDVRAQATGASSLGRPHLARALVEKKLATSVQDAFDRYLADEGEGYVALERLGASEAIALIRRSGGVAVVAHPKRLRAPEHLEALIGLGVDGIEILHPTADEHDTAVFETLARERGLLVTGGTDFHAPVPGRSLGVELPESDVRALREAIAARAAYK